VKDINPTGNSNPKEMYVSNGVLYFAADDGVHGSELWQTDGMEFGTVLIRDLLVGSGGSSPENFVEVNGDLYFTATLVEFSRDIWKSDGTPEGSSLVKRFSYWGVWPDITSLTNHHGTLLFGASTSLWKSDGTEAGTVPVRDNVGEIRRFVEANGVLYVETSRTLWITNLSTVGTIRLDGVSIDDDSAGDLTDVDGTLFFSGDQIGRDVDLWVIRPDSPSGVIGRHIFYNNSKYDNHTPAANANDDAAIAADKFAVRPGTTSVSFSNLTSYVRGINGIMLDVINPPREITAADLQFRMGTSARFEEWVAAPAPVSVTVRRGQGLLGADRVTIVWADGAIKNTYLQIVLNGNDLQGGYNTNTGLADSDVFYFGNLVGDTFTGRNYWLASVDDDDKAQVRSHVGFGVPVTSPYDFNRDGLVNAADQIILRNQKVLDAYLSLFGSAWGGGSLGGNGTPFPLPFSAMPPEMESVAAETLAMLAASSVRARSEFRIRTGVPDVITQSICEPVDLSQQIADELSNLLECDRRRHLGAARPTLAAQTPGKVLKLSEALGRAPVNSPRL
jgi:ELWxxDGT repeat protein